MRKIKRNFVLVCLLFSCSLLMSSSVGWPPTITDPLRNIYAFEGARVFFKCKVSASPGAVFDTFLNNNPVIGDDNFIRYYNGNEALLTIMEVIEEYSGDVAFVFTNTIGRSTTEAILIVVKP